MTSRVGKKSLKISLEAKLSREWKLLWIKCRQACPGNRMGQSRYRSQSDGGVKAQECGECRPSWRRVLGYGKQQLGSEPEEKQWEWLQVGVLTAPGSYSTFHMGLWICHLSHPHSSFLAPVETTVIWWSLVGAFSQTSLLYGLDRLLIQFCSPPKLILSNQNFMVVLL